MLWRTRFEAKGIYAIVYEPRQFSELADQIKDQPALKRYEAGGRQLIVIAAGGGKSKDPSTGKYVTFVLPKEYRSDEVCLVSSGRQIPP